MAKIGLILAWGLMACAPPDIDSAPEFICKQDSECSEGAPHCNRQGHCVACITAADCPNCHYECSADGSCIMLDDRGFVPPADKTGKNRILCLPEKECTPGENCCSLGYFCNIYSGDCLSVADYTRFCTTENGCPDGLVCDIYHQVCVPQPACRSQYNCCTVAEQVSGAALSCSAIGKCNDYEVVCTPPEEANSACPFLPKKSEGCDEGKFCVPPGICVQCTCDADCPEGSNLVCNLATGLCKSIYSCQTSADCTSANQLCDTSSGRCVAKCNEDIECGFNEYCNRSLHICRPENQRPCEADGYEPNEDKSSAYRLSERPLLVEGIKCPGDQDWYILPLKRADQVTLKIYEVNQSSGTVYLDLLHSDGATVLGSTNNGFFAKTITFTANEDGDYYLWVYTSTQESSLEYAIAISYATGEVCRDFLEEGEGKNNQIGQATPILEAYGQCRHDTSSATRHQVICEGGDLIICSGDRDYYRIDIPDGYLLKATVYGQSAPLELVLLTENGIVRELPASPERQTIFYAGRPGGTYYLAVGAASLAQTVYNLAITLWDGNKEEGCHEDSNDALEYNDDIESLSRASRVILRAGENEVSANLCLGDRDVYHLLLNDGQSDGEIPAGYKLTATFAPMSGGSELVLYRQAGNELLPIGLQQGNYWQLDVTDGNPLFAVIQNSSFEQAIEYKVNFVLTLPPDCQEDLFEDNGNPLLAKSLAAGEHDGLTLCNADSDWYKLTVPSGGNITIDLKYDVTLPAPDCRLYNQRLLQVSDFADESNYQGLVLASREITAGWQRLHVVGASEETYYLLVKNSRGWPIADYSLSVNYPVAACVADQYAAADNHSAGRAALLPLTADNNYTFFAPDLTICQNDEEDWYALEAAGGDIVDIKVHYQPGEGNLDLYLYPQVAMTASSAVQHVAYDWDDTAPYLGLLHITYTVPEEQKQQKWPFVVRPYQAVGSLTFNNLYAMEVAVRRDCVADGIGASKPPAVSDGHSDAGYLNYRAGDFATYSPEKLPLDGSDLSGTLSLCGNEDWFLLKLDETNLGGERGVTICAAFDHNAGDIDLELYAADNLAQPLAESATKKNIEGIIFTSRAKMGYYYLRVFLDPRDVGSKVLYKLRVFGGSSFETAGCQGL